MKEIIASKDPRVDELEFKTNRLELKIEEFKFENQKQQLLVVALQQQINQRANSTDSSYYSKPVVIPGSIKSVAAASEMPKNCNDLNAIGHTTGIHLVMGTKQIETVYCDFTKLPSDLGIIYDT